MHIESTSKPDFCRRFKSPRVSSPSWLAVTRYQVPNQSARNYDAKDILQPPSCLSTVRACGGLTEEGVSKHCIVFTRVTVWAKRRHQHSAHRFWSNLGMKECMYKKRLKGGQDTHSFSALELCTLFELLVFIVISIASVSHVVDHHAVIPVLLSSWKSQLLLFDVSCSCHRFWKQILPHVV